MILRLGFDKFLGFFKRLENVGPLLRKMGVLKLGFSLVVGVK